MITSIDIQDDLIKKVDELKNQNKFKFRSRTQAINYFLYKGISEYTKDEKLITFFKKMFGE